LGASSHLTAAEAIEEIYLQKPGQVDPYRVLPFTVYLRIKI
jgi:hypothetical protein